MIKHDFIKCYPAVVVVNAPPEYTCYVFDDFTIYLREMAKLNEELKHFENMPRTKGTIHQIGSLVIDRFKLWEQCEYIRKREFKMDLVFPPNEPEKHDDTQIKNESVKK
jgi:hypothetical protein